MECVQKTSTDVTEYIYGRCTSSGVKGGIGIPGFDSFLVGLEHEHAGDRARHRPGRRPAAGQHDAPLGVRHHGRHLHDADRARGSGSAFGWWRKRDFPQTRWFLRATAVSGVAAVVALECGWIVTEVGRQPWVVYNVMRTEDAVTQASGVWVTFVAVVALYVVLGAALVITLRAMARRWREADEPDDDVPYGPAPSARRRSSRRARG